MRRISREAAVEFRRGRKSISGGIRRGCIPSPLRGYEMRNIKTGVSGYGALLEACGFDMPYTPRSPDSLRPHADSPEVNFKIFRLQSDRPFREIPWPALADLGAVEDRGQSPVSRHDLQTVPFADRFAR